METLDDLIGRLTEIRAQGYIPTHRAGPTGIGKTLEDLLGIQENNIDISNTTFAELKSARKGSGSMVSLFTKAPLGGANARLLSNYGYVTSKTMGRKVLHTTAWAKGFNSLRGKVGFKVVVSNAKVSLVSGGGEELAYWDEATLRHSFEGKLHHVLHILASCRGSGSGEAFWFNEAWLLTGFDFEGFKAAVTSGTVCVDIRIGQYADGRPHDHGTGFRVLPDKLGLCFKDRKKLL